MNHLHPYENKQVDIFPRQTKSQLMIYASDSQALSLAGRCLEVETSQVHTQWEEEEEEGENRLGYIT